MSGSRYSAIAIALHWAIAILLLGQIAGGLLMTNLPNSAALKFDLYQLHKSFGLSILALVIVRLAWRLSHRPPALPASIAAWQRGVARATHWTFYALLILTPLVGWAIVSVSPIEVPTKYFGVVPIPHLPLNAGDAKGAERFIADWHKFFSFAIIGLFIIHVIAAAKHAFLDKDGVMASMAPRAGHWIAVAVVLGALFVGAAVYFVSAGSAQTARSDASSAAARSALPVAAPQSSVPAWTVDYEASELAFIGMEGSSEFRGAFEDWSADIRFDPEDLANSSVVVSVRTASAATGGGVRDATMKDGEWFDVGDHPEATFVSETIREAGDGAYEAAGTLTIKEIAQPIVLPFTLEIDGDAATAAGGVDLIRTDFGLGVAASWLEAEKVALEVRVEFAVEATREK